VAETVLDFTKYRPDAFIFVQGSTAARTRLYQMGIFAFWDEINSLFMVLGYLNEEWEPFTKGKNYESFLIKRK
jgi:hypothetical protein